MGEQKKLRSVHELRAVMLKAGDDILNKRMSRRQHTAILAQVEAELAAQGRPFTDLLYLDGESPGGSGAAVECGPQEGTGTSG
jgi:hypothetical protein